MADKPAGTSESQETTVDRFEHEIEDLESPLGTGVRQWLVGLLVAAALVGAFFLGSALQRRRAEPGSNAITSIDTLDPKPSHLTDKPSVFRWESIAGATSYVVRIQESGGTTDLIARETKNNWLELTMEEQARLVKGGSYSWSVRARSSDGWPIGQGESNFSL